jgi:hypothetical protein
MLSVKPEELPQFVRSIYQLMPDRRVLYAASQIQKIVTGEEPKILALKFEQGRWAIQLDNTVVGTLPEIPTFADSKMLLSDWAKREVAGRAAAGQNPYQTRLPQELEQALVSGGASDVLEALGSLNDLWKTSPMSPEILQAATRGYLWLSLQTYDRLNLSDPLLGKSLALLVLAQQSDASKPMPGEEALLCWELGYETAADAASARLPQGDPLRLFITDERAKLRTLAEAPNSSAQVQYLSLYASARTETADRWFGLLGKSRWGDKVSLTSLGLAMHFGDFGMAGSLPASLASEAFMTARSASGRRATAQQKVASARAEGDWRETYRGYLASSLEPRKPAERLLKPFESSVEAKASQSNGPLLDGACVRAFYYATLYSAIHETARYLFDRLGVDQSAAGFANGISDPPAGTASELKKWILDRVAYYRDNSQIYLLSEDLATLKHIGVVPLTRIRYTIERSTYGTNENRRRPMRSYFERLDTRPWFLVEAGRVANMTLFDLPLMELYLRAAADLAPVASEDMTPWCARYCEDAKWLEQIADSPRIASRNRAAALQSLTELKAVDQHSLRNRFKRVLHDSPGDRSALDCYVAYLEKKGDLAEAEAAVRTWIVSMPDDTGPALANATALRAELLRKMGKLDEAWSTVQPAIESWAEAPMVEGVAILIRKGELGDAMALAQQCAQRYPRSSEPLIEMAEIRWRKGDDAGAAQTLGSAQKVFASDDWDTLVAPAFYGVFATQDSQRTERAFDEIAKRTSDLTKLLSLPFEFKKNKKPAIAARLYERLPASGATAADAKLSVFDALKDVEGKEAALLWLQKNTGRYDNQLALIVFQSRRFELLWDLFPAPPKPEKNDVLNILRAGALTQERKVGDPRWQAIKDYFQNQPKSSDFIDIGRFLAGEESAKELLTCFTNIGTICDASWALGLKAASEDRYKDAADWFQVCLEANQPTRPPTEWSYEVLLRWLNKKSFLTAVAKARVI